MDDAVLRRVIAVAKPTRSDRPTDTIILRSFRSEILLYVSAMAVKSFFLSLHISKWLDNFIMSIQLGFLHR